MAHLRRSVVSLRISGTAVVPGEISCLLGGAPTTAYAKGDELVGKKTGHRRTAPFGLWLLSGQPREPGNLDEQILKILAGLTHDLTVWKSLSERYSVELFCGLFMGNYNDGASISVQSLRALASRFVKLDLDIYALFNKASDDHPAADIDLP